MAEEVAKIEDKEWKPSKSPWLISFPVIFAAFMFVLDETIANVALPYMAGSFSVSREESTWVLTSYLVASGIVIPTVGWFSKLMGRKNFFLASIALFTFASFMCGISTSLPMIIIARIIQGFGGGGLLPIAQAILLETFPKEKRGMAMAAFGLVIVFAPIVGPVLGGWLTINYSWHWIFFVNIPIGFIAIYVSQLLLEDPPYARKQGGVPIDALGFSLLILWLVTLQVVLDKGNNADWFHTTWICQLTAVSVLALVGLLWSQIKRKNTLLDLFVFKDKNYRIGTFVQVIMMGILLGSMAILPQFLQLMLGYDAFLSGLSMMPRGCGALLAMVICGTLSSRVNNKLLTIIGLFFMGVAGFAFGFLNLQISSLNIAIPNFLYGFGMGFAMIPIVSLSVITLSNEQMTNASGLQNLLKNIGGAIGTSIVTTMITRFSQIHQANMVGHLNALNPIFIERMNTYTAALSQYTHGVTANYMAQKLLYQQLVQQATLWGFMDAFRMFGCAAIAIIPLIFLIRSKG